MLYFFFQFISVYVWLKIKLHTLEPKSCTYTFLIYKNLLAQYLSAHVVYTHSHTWSVTHVWQHLNFLIVWMYPLFYNFVNTCIHLKVYVSKIPGNRRDHVFLFHFFVVKPGSWSYKICAFFIVIAWKQLTAIQGFRSNAVWIKYNIKVDSQVNYLKPYKKTKITLLLELCQHAYVLFHKGQYKNETTLTTNRPQVEIINQRNCSKTVVVTNYAAKYVDKETMPEEDQGITLLNVAYNIFGTQ